MFVEAISHRSLLLGMATEQMHRPRQTRSGGVVSGSRQQDDERAEFGCRQPLPVDLGLHEQRRDVIAGVLATTPTEFHRVLEELRDRTQARVHIADLVIIDPENQVDELPQLRPVRGGNVEEVGDHLERKVGADGLDEVEGSSLTDVLDDGIGQLADVGGHLPDGSWRERHLHEAPILLMLGIVHRDDRAQHGEQLWWHVVEREPPGAREPERIAGHRPYTGIRRHRPVARTVVACDEFQSITALPQQSEVRQPRGDVTVPERRRHRRIGRTRDSHTR